VQDRPPRIGVAKAFDREFLVSATAPDEFPAVVAALNHDYYKFK
jgi:hypothetical protein